MKSLNISSMKKVGGDKDHSKFQHKDGHVIIIAHAPLAMLQRKQLEKLPIHAWEGESDVQAPETDTTDTDDSSSQGLQDVSKSFKGALGFSNGGILPAHLHGKEQHESNPKLEQSKVRNYPPKGQIETLRHLAKGGKAKAQDTAEDDALDQAAPQTDESTAEDVADQAQAPQSAPTQGATDPNNTVGAVVNQGQQGNQVTPVDAGTLQTVLKPGMDFNTAAANVNQANAAINTGLANQAQQNFQAIQNHTNALAQDYANRTIDPERFIKDHGKVKVAMGILLGGLGQGMMGTSTNQALDFLKFRMQNDIDAQHNEQDKSKTLLGAYQHLFGEGQVANAASATGVRDAYKSIMKQVALQNGTPQAAAAAGALSNQIDAASNQDMAAAAHQHALKQAVVPSPQPSQPPQPAQPQSWADKIRPYLPTGEGVDLKTGKSIQPKVGTPNAVSSTNTDIDRTIPDSEPAPQFRVNDAAIKRVQTAQQAQGEEGDLAGLPPSSSIQQLQKEGAMAKSANAKMDLIHENYKDLWANRGDSNAALKYMSDLGVNVGGAHLTLPDLTSLTPQARAYYRAASTIENELAGLVGSGGLTQQQAESIRKRFMRQGDTPDDYRKNLKSLDQYILSLPQMQTPAGDTNPGFITRPKVK